LVPGEKASAGKTTKFDRGSNGGHILRGELPVNMWEREEIEAVGLILEGRPEVKATRG